MILVIRAVHPSRNGIGIVLMLITTLTRKAFAPQGRVHFNYCRPSSSDTPAIERPEVNTPSRLTPQMTQPGQPCVG
jgi:hypothetical protein